MTRRYHYVLAVCASLAGFCGATSATLGADDAVDWKRQFELLQQQNTALQEQLRQQQKVIESLGTRMSEIETNSAQRNRDIADLKADADAAPQKSSSFNLGRMRFTGEGGVGLFHTGREGQYPNSDFRVDEARLFAEAPIWGDVFFFGELDLATRENTDINLKLGELYLDFANVSQLWGKDRQLNLRVGRIDTPFGEEYQSRDAIDNPLISHSVADLWSTDAGVEVYGSLGKFSYALAVQNGGNPSGNRDFNPDKAVAARLSYDPNRWLHLSLSAMRTGDLDAKNDYLSQLWFGDAFVRSLGTTNAGAFHANLLEGDVMVRLPHGRIRAAGGLLNYGDNDTARDNGRDVFYYSFEVIHDVTRKFYLGARFSEVMCEEGFLVAGNGDMGRFFFSPFSPLTTELWRLSLGAGYRFSDRLIIKSEYSFERGRELGGRERQRQDFFGAEAVFKF